MASLDEAVKRAVASHPGTRFGRLVWICAAVAGASWIAIAVVDHDARQLVYMVGAVLLGGWVWLTLRRGVRSAVILNMAVERVSRGRFDDAEALHAQLSPAAKVRGSSARSLAIQRAWIAFERGDAAAAIEHATTAIAIRPSLAAWIHDRMLRVAGYARRAVAHASLGHELEATRDADEVERSPFAGPDVLALASLARALLLAKRADYAGLATHLRRDETLLAEDLRPGERALVRALRQMARSGGNESPYRRPAKAPDPGDRTPLAAWLESVVPGAAEFAPAPALYVGSTEERARIAPDVQPSSLGPRRGFWGSPGRRFLLLWALLVVMFLAIWQVLQSGQRQGAESVDDTAGQASNDEPGEPPPAPAPWTSTALVVGPTIAVVLILLGGIVWHQLVVGRRLLRARGDMVRGREEQARATLAALAKSRYPLVAASAQFELARFAERRAEWDTVLAAVDAGIQRAVRNPGARVAAADYLIPGLVVMRALALAASGRAAESEAARALLDRDYPSYGFAAYAHYRVALVAAAHAGDLERAIAVARTRTPALPLTIREDLLTDVVLAATGSLPETELRRIAAELQDDAPSRNWIDAVAPRLRRELDARAAAVG
jgi:hypothetical protein